ncbi:hypothetical protein SELMODRAFT_426566 [Selaginella moellendorffii]|uniref:Uncharacterized protein n=1 Tax=Selaginella moellendorffii TaxID=88036 RepID=D8SWS4_SELML|nr:hypothetical protein SELMODRAFT_426566 [Selaginella moellendorffii]
MAGGGLRQVLGRIEQPNMLSFMAAMSAITGLVMCKAGRLIHESIVRVELLKRGKWIHLQPHCLVSNMVVKILLNMYAKCGQLLLKCVNRYKSSSLLQETVPVSEEDIIEGRLLRVTLELSVGTARFFEGRKWELSVLSPSVHKAVNDLGITSF